MYTVSKSASPISNGFRRATHHCTSQQTNSRNTNFVQLMVKNLDPSLSVSEWRRILMAHFQSIMKNPFHLHVMRQSDIGYCAIAKILTKEDAQLAISYLNRRKIGYRRIYVSFLKERYNRKLFSSNPPTNQRFQFGQKMNAIKVQADNMPLFIRRKGDESAQKAPFETQGGVSHHICMIHYNDRFV